MAKKRKPAQSRATIRTSEPIDFKGRPPMVCTLGEDLEESRRLQARLEELRQQVRAAQPLTT